MSLSVPSILTSDDKRYASSFAQETKPATMLQIMTEVRRKMRFCDIRIFSRVFSLYRLLYDVPKRDYHITCYKYLHNERIITRKNSFVSCIDDVML